MMLPTMAPPVVTSRTARASRTSVSEAPGPSGVWVSTALFASRSGIERRMPAKTSRRSGAAYQMNSNPSATAATTQDATKARWAKRVHSAVVRGSALGGSGREGGVGASVGMGIAGIPGRGASCRGRGVLSP